MFKRVSIRVRGIFDRAPDSPTPIVRAPETISEKAFCGSSPRRGGTRRPLGMVRIQNRRRNQIARASRKANRS